MTYLLDTNVVSEIRRTRGDAGVKRWYQEAPLTDLRLSVLVLGEISQGIERLRRRGDHGQADRIDVWLASLKADFADRLVPVSSAIAERWGRINAVQLVPIIDGLMAATALEHDLTFVTRDVESLAGTGVRLLNPWDTH